MSDDELSDEERALLATADQTQLGTEAAQMVPVDPEPVAEQQKTVKPKKPSRATPEPVATDSFATANAVNAAIPAQMTYDEGPWGLLPTQMRHDSAGNPVH